MKKILVTGGCGRLGAEIVRTLLARGDAVIAADLAVSPEMAALSAANPKLTTTATDLGEWQQVRAPVPAAPARGGDPHRGDRRGGARR